MYSAQLAAQHPGMTHWFNPTKNPVTVEIRKGPPKFRKREEGGRPVMVDSGVEHVVWQPGDERWLSSEYDEAIQAVDAHTKLVTHGLAPQLVKNGQQIDVHPALDVEGQKKKDAVEQAARALADQQAAAGALLVAQATVNAANAAKADVDAMRSGAQSGGDVELEKMRMQLELEKTQAVKAEAEAKKAEADAKKADAQALKARADADKAEAEAMTADAKKPAGASDAAKGGASK